METVDEAAVNADANFTVRRWKLGATTERVATGKLFMVAQRHRKAVLVWVCETPRIEAGEREGMMIGRGWSLFFRVIITAMCEDVSLWFFLECSRLQQEKRAARGKVPPSRVTNERRGVFFTHTDAGAI